MTNKEFIYWLKGFSEGLGGPPDPKSWQYILNNLSNALDEDISVASTNNSIHPSLQTNPISNSDGTKNHISIPLGGNPFNDY